jgi:predicted permease
MLQDLRFALRLLVKDRTFTVTALLTLAVCLGANTAIFGVVRSVLLKPLPVPDGDRIMLVYNSYPNAGSAFGSAGVPDYFDRVRDAPAFAEQALYRARGVSFDAGASAERLSSVLGTPSFFRLVRAQPQLGRIFTDDEGEYGKNDAVILSDGFWRRQFASDPAIVGRIIRLDGTSYRVVGVMPRGFRFLWKDVDVWLPEAFSVKQKSDDARHSNNWDEIGRLKPGATLAQAQQQIDAINARNDERFPQMAPLLHDAGFHTVVVPLQDFVVREIRPVLYLLWGGVLFVLLLGCVNLANLVLVRSIGRTREFATRHAIGAGVARLVRQLLTETTLLAVAGGALGLLGGSWVLRTVGLWHLDEMPRGYEIQLDPIGAATMLSLAVLVGLLLGLVPVARVSRLNVNGALREESRSGTSGRGTHRVRNALATAQVAIAFLLLIGAGLLAASFRAVLRIDPGFQPSGVITASVNLPNATYGKSPTIVSFVDRALAALRRLPDVEAVGVTDTIPFGGDYSDNVILAEGYQMTKGESLISPYDLGVSDGYFETMRVPLVRGRFFNAADTAESTKVAVIDERLAAKFWPGRDPIGRRLYGPNDLKNPLAVTPKTQYITVVGVVREVPLTGLVSTDRRVGTYYLPLSQSPSRILVVAVRARGNAAAIVGDLRKTIAAIDPSVPLFGVHTMMERLDDSLVDRRLPMLLAMTFGAVSLFLAAIGIYGVLAYQVAQRRREIGIRLALGSSAREVFGLILGGGVKIVGVGLAIGFVGALGVGQLMRGVLYGVQPTDPVVLLAVAAILSAVALLATALPAGRAARVNPAMALNDH